MIWRRSWRWFGAGAWAFPCDPDLPCNRAPVIWDVAAQPTAVVLGTASFANDSSVRFADLPVAVLAEDIDDRRHELWPDDGDHQQVLIMGRPAGSMPVAAIVPLDAHTTARLDAVRRLWRRLTGRPASTPVLPITAQQRRRLILMLRALDGWREHATYRELATILLNADVRRQSRRDWLTSTTRAQMIRIVRDAVRRMEGGYRDLLCGR